jgi:tRNA pseudouridine13 synthase
MTAPYLTKSGPLEGRLKQRISDFQVEEILPDGTVCKIEQLHTDPPKRTLLKIPENTDPKKNDQLHVFLETFNLETTFAIRNLTRGIGCSTNRVGYAGMKDKRGITCQRISIWRPAAERLEKFSMRGIALHHPQWSNKRIELGDLRGNYFKITIRDIPADKEETAKKIEQFRQELSQGIPNYYGEQRFGGYRKITHIVGKKLIENDIEGAVMDYLTKTNDSEEPAVQKAREALKKTRNFDKALKDFPQAFHFERVLLHYLQQFPNDFVGAFQRLPKKTRYLFTHAYQSHLFNLILKERIKKGLLYPVEGDVLENGIPTIPLIGKETKFAGGIAGKIEQAVFEKENISKEDFKKTKLKEVSSFGSRKPMLLHVHDFKIVNAEEDDINENKTKATVSFWLKKGAYATTVLRELLKNDNL